MREWFGSHGAHWVRDVLSIVKVFVLVAMMSMDDVEIPVLELPPIQQTGIASWYGGGSGDNGLHGKITATGEVFNPARRTCAHRTIRLHTIVIIEDLDTGNKTWCRISDRGPYGGLDENGQWLLKLKESDPGEWRGIADLSKGTAEKLGLDLRRGMYNIAIRHY